jgi:N-terminal domain of anti-restriction factor ArdC
MKSEQIKEITDRAAEQLVAALQAGHSEALTVYLKAIGRFHHYSLHNVLLIASQKPNASYVAGFRTWKGLGRFVKKGEKGIMILAPIIRRKAQNDDEERDEISRPIAGFRAAFVFDISQTDGKELPQIGVVQGNPRQYGDQLRQFASSQNILVEFSADIAPARGISPRTADRRVRHGLLERKRWKRSEDSFDIGDWPLICTTENTTQNRRQVIPVSPLRRRIAGTPVFPNDSPQADGLAGYSSARYPPHGGDSDPAGLARKLSN